MAVTIHLSQKGGKGCGYVFFGFFALAGVFMFVGMFSAVWDGIRSRFWTAVPASITHSDVTQTNGKYLVDLAYQFSFDGRTRFGTRLKPTGSNGFDHQSEAERAAQRYREG